mmetsp:Transcript_33904/g.64797  ORF Transcript_33904/g.64797 Transcript_33904/m.64797 type:complete len:179 (-) Transcript_33904:459-995(-)|eukprot:CAMPEP_0114251540 /NCGR_PEP_ID=MMETSP0058-20121206/15326_1 /TAXON_ID=36894 /ORGANISM="Pyramimonas parkeae, CCMP726" /LENGTH=178 /DNA_ID=CAMNT_0001365351 /DNA_START=346 /DNA_END=882 /DNA_ORIENTATION=-
MGRGGHSDDEGTPYDQSLEELDFLRSACAHAQRGRVAQLSALLSRRPELIYADGVDGTSGYTPLHYAAREGQLECVNLLIERGANVDSKTRAGGATALHRAAYMGHTEIIKSLLRSGADPNSQDSDGETPLHKASSRGHASAVQELLAAGPSASEVYNRKQQRPADCAVGEAAQIFAA